MEWSCMAPWLYLLPSAYCVICKMYTQRSLRLIIRVKISFTDHLPFRTLFLFLFLLFLWISYCSANFMKHLKIFLHSSSNISSWFWQQGIKEKVLWGEIHSDTSNDILPEPGVLQSFVLANSEIWYPLSLSSFHTLYQSMGLAQSN